MPQQTAYYHKMHYFFSYRLNAFEILIMYTTLIQCAAKKAFEFCIFIVSCVTYFWCVFCCDIRPTCE